MMKQDFPAGKTKPLMLSLHNICLLHSVYHEEITENLLKGAKQYFEELPKASRPSFFSMAVPGAFELPLACKWQLATKQVSAVIAMGCLLRGETPHFGYISAACVHGLQSVALECVKPVGFAVLTANTLEQAKQRSSLEPALLHCNKGYETAMAVGQMLSLVKNKE